VREDLRRAKLALADEQAHGAQAEADLAAAQAELERLRRIEALLQDLDTQIIPITKKLDERAGDGQVRLLWRGAELALVGEGFALRPDQTLQLWTTLDGKAVTSAGLFKDLRPGGGVVGLHTLPGPPGDVAAFIISLEDADGSPDPHAPVGPAILISE
jgi:hypothetical protein